MPVFYTNLIQGNVATLSEEEARHCAQVLRMRTGDEVEVVDGSGLMANGTLVEVNKKTVVISLSEKKEEWLKPKVNVHLAISPTKNIDRMEWLVEKAVEIGVSEISFLLCQHSERKRIRLDRLEKRAIAAMKQSRRAYLPQLRELIPFGKWMEQQEGGQGQKFIAHCEEALPHHLVDQYQTGQDVTILIGPEGDFSPAEIKMALDQGFEGITLGDMRLRTETAGLFCCMAIHLKNID